MTQPPDTQRLLATVASTEENAAAEMYRSTTTTAIIAAAIAWRRAVKEYLTISSTAPWNSRAALGQRIQRLERELSILVDNLEQGSPK